MVVRISNGGKELVVFDPGYITMIDEDTVVFVELTNDKLRLHIPENLKLVVQTFEDEEENK